MAQPFINCIREVAKPPAGEEKIVDAMLAPGPYCDITGRPDRVRFVRQTGKHLLTLSSSLRDPNQTWRRFEKYILS